VKTTYTTGRDVTATRWQAAKSAVTAALEFWSIPALEK
jgi:hypothetical protein